MTILHPAILSIGAAIAIITMLFLRKRQSYPWLILPGLLLIATAAGGPSIALHPTKKVAVMVDLSPSTRTAAYRDRSALLHRINELAGNSPAQILVFSDHVEPLPATDILPDIPCEQTSYAPPIADAILLFSDGRFPLPETDVPTYPIIDPLLIDPPDGSIREMHFDGESAVAAVVNHGDARNLIWTGTAQSKPILVPTGTSIIRGGRAVASIIQTRLTGTDPWPENDSLTLPAPAPQQLQYWWIGTAPPPRGWQAIAPSDLPTDPSAYLAAGAIALSNVSATDLSDTQQRRLAQYVRDLGGSLLIFGGDHAFSAGGYSGTELDSLSPLASDPPAPTTHWMLLVDSSGSMAQSSNGVSHWQAAVEAMLRLPLSLPPKDLVSIGSFARDLSWWIDAQPAEIARHLTAPPPNIGPDGPTNLDPVLTQIAHRTDPTPCELLLLTDADTTIDNAPALAASLIAAKVRVSLLALGSVPMDNPVVRIVTATGGHWIASDDPTRWIDSLRKLMRSAAPTHLQSTRLTVRFDASLGIPDRNNNLWNRTWIKAGAISIAVALADQTIPLAARWQVGLGSVAAFAFSPTVAEATTLAKQIAAPPRDPRFKVTWQCDSTISVSVNASTESDYLNGLHFVLNLGDQSPGALKQTEPGRYSLEIPASRSPTLATIQFDGHVIDRRSIAGRYAPEFDAIGNDDAALEQLASRTGGQVIAPNQHTPITFRWPLKFVRIDSYLAGAGAILVGACLVLSPFSRPAVSAVSRS